MPLQIAPQFATSAKQLPAAGNWLYEIKLDGYRMMLRIKSGRVQLFKKNGHNWTARSPGLTPALAALPVHGARLDGEIVVPNVVGRPDFSALQNAFDTPHQQIPCCSSSTFSGWMASTCGRSRCTNTGDCTRATLHDKVTH
ncbi:hypothetical protein G3N59_25350 [Paraburkholderia sp. Ac-20340]|uniref:ATP-dependent DNA ligase n=1 Tax=Paraburkholderia sp. Ac-20340 TaxID=2703888 RepID=UPI00197E7986|nr:hypothetical protein [Paraburkholderia sp. Ac-20340]MBN3856712.1 hypothetical protein [Paraburkholderia sp. Ac-20340]